MATDMAESHEVPTVNCRITLALFTNVSNAAQLRGEALSGKVKAVLLDPTLVSAHPGTYMYPGPHPGRGMHAPVIGDTTEYGHQGAIEA